MAASQVDLKVVLLGHANVGKTCLVERFLHDKWSEGAHVPTVGAAFGAKKMGVNGKTVTVGIWDTAGSERYESMTRHYFRGAAGAVVCFDLTDAESFERAQYWVRELNSVQDDCVISLVGTKVDLVEGDSADQRRAVTPADVGKFARSIDAKYFETSAKTGFGTDAPFSNIVAQAASLGKLKMPAVYEPKVLVMATPGRRNERNNAPASGDGKPCKCG